MSARLQLLCFLVGGRTFAIDIMGIREILRNQRFTPVPHTPPHVAGVINLRGEMIPVVDLHQLLIGGPNPASREELKLVVGHSRGRMAGLLVDQVLDVVTISPESLVPAPAGSGDGRKGGLVLATFQKGEGSARDVVVLVRLGLLVAGAAAPVEEEARDS